ncbi:hypothetical protein J6590_101135 [Homalodisca vitripennis]|nr:hypothetical protein J6590_101135 [Homalodisca vitripennis]
MNSRNNSVGTSDRRVSGINGISAVTNLAGFTPLDRYTVFNTIFAIFVRLLCIENENQTPQVICNVFYSVEKCKIVKYLYISNVLVE